MGRKQKKKSCTHLWRQNVGNKSDCGYKNENGNVEHSLWCVVCVCCAGVKQGKLFIPLLAGISRAIKKLKIAIEQKFRAHRRIFYVSRELVNWQIRLARLVNGVVSGVGISCFRRVMSCNPVFLVRDLLLVQSVEN